MKTYIVTDTITVARAWRVRARTAAEAIDLAAGLVSVPKGRVRRVREDQIDNSPYEAVEVPLSAGRAP